MRKLQNPPKAEPERTPEPHTVKGVWKAAALLAAALALKPGAAGAQYIPPPPHCNPWISGGRVWNYDLLRYEYISHPNPSCRSNIPTEATGASNYHPTLDALMRDAIGDVLLVM